MDVLTDVLDALELRGCIAARRALVSPWHYAFAASNDMIFHLLSAGGGYLTLEGEPVPRRIEGGGVLLFPFGHAHSICDEPASPLNQVLQVTYSAQREYRFAPDAGEGEQGTRLVSGQREPVPCRRFTAVIRLAER